jgi:uncharacterized protein YecT (DUF1311 family)
MTRSTLLAASLLLLITPASAEAPAKDDVATVTACLDLAAQNAGKGGATRDELSEKAGSEGRLAAASAAAGADKASCIGVLATTCVQREGNLSNATLNQCYGREAQVWDARLNAAYRAASAKIDRDAAENLRETQRAWIVWRDASCAQPGVTFKGTMAGPMREWCVLDLTARQAIWMQGWGE